jgi:hypothetical protein
MQLELRGRHQQRHRQREAGQEGARQVRPEVDRAVAVAQQKEARLQVRVQKLRVLQALAFHHLLPHLVRHWGIFAQPVHARRAGEQLDGGTRAVLFHGLLTELRQLSVEDRQVAFQYVEARGEQQIEPRVHRQQLVFGSAGRLRPEERVHPLEPHRGRERRQPLPVLDAPLQSVRGNRSDHDARAVPARRQAGVQEIRRLVHPAEQQHASIQRGAQRLVERTLVARQRRHHHERRPSGVRHWHLEQREVQYVVDLLTLTLFFHWLKPLDTRRQLGGGAQVRLHEPTSQADVVGRGLPHEIVGGPERATQFQRRRQNLMVVLEFLNDHTICNDRSARRWR